MPIDESKPLIAAAFVCERVLVEEGNIYSAIRIVDKYTMMVTQINALPDPNAKPVLPVPSGQQILTPPAIDMTALVMLRAGSLTGKHEVSIVIQDPNGTDRPFPQTMPVEFKLNNPAEAAILNIKLLLPNNAPEGLYWINVLWDAEPLTRIPVSLRREGFESGGQLPAAQQ